MSRIGKRVITIPQGVTVEASNTLLPVAGSIGYLVSVTGSNGTVLVQEVKAPIQVSIRDNCVIVERMNDESQSKALHGLYNRLIQNMITGVTDGFTKTLILNGVGYKANMKGEDLVLNLGKSHPDEIKAEKGIKVKILTPAEIQTLNLGKEGVGVVIQVSGANNAQVGQFASKIRACRPVEPYYMYGIRYSDEHIIRKETKKAKGGKGGGGKAGGAAGAKGGKK